MVFTTHLFLFYFLPLVLLLYYLCLNRIRTALLAIASYVFYGWADPWWAGLMFVSTMVDYACGLTLVRIAGLSAVGGELPVIPSSQRRTPMMKWVLGLSIGSNLALLAFFKYYNFAAENADAIARSFGLSAAALRSLHVVLPVGISFYTFQSMSYCIDVYRGDAPATRSLVDFCCFEALFPQLVAGPIVRYSHLVQQLPHRTHTADKFARGVAFFSCGMAKKILLANPMGHVADAAFAANSLHWHDAWFGTIAYAFQIYFDFSGYSDMAMGLALMLGFALVPNFNAPYRAESITDFWRRWHISLSTWLRDYLYIPLGGNRLGPSRTYVNLMLVMLIGGLWHGASWTFVCWAALHGTMLCGERLVGRRAPYHALPRFVRICFTFTIVCVGWVFFRADSIAHAFGYLSSMFGGGQITSAAALVESELYSPYHVLVFLIATAIVWLAPTTWTFTHRLPAWRAATVLILLAVAVTFMWTQTSNPFLYFRF